jgi:hypothetical protein
MPAPNYQTLYDFETQLETAWATVFTVALAAIPITCQVLSTRNAATEDAPRVELECLVGPALTQRKGLSTGTYREVPNAFKFTLITRIVTTRPTNDNQHGVIRGLIRYNLTASANVVTAQLAYLQILEQLMQSGTSHIIDEKEQDVSELTYDGWFAINETAWP